MPTYEYQCADCKDVQDLIRSIADGDEPAVCVKCNGVARKIISKPALVWAPTSGGYR